MTTALEEPAMAEKKRTQTMAKVDSELLRMAKAIAAYEDKTLADYLDGIIRAAVERDHAKHIRRFQSKKEEK
jgi:hypothetical protein